MIYKKPHLVALVKGARGLDNKQLVEVYSTKLKPLFGDFKNLSANSFVVRYRINNLSLQIGFW